MTTNTTAPAPPLTKRQRRALVAAHEMGYYDLPRPVTLRTVAARLGTSATALSELLRRAEAALVEHALELGWLAHA
jgi:predicted DNA binding protein